MRAALSLAGWRKLSLASASCKWCFTRALADGAEDPSKVSAIDRGVIVLPLGCVLLSAPGMHLLAGASATLMSATSFGKTGSYAGEMLIPVVGSDPIAVTLQVEIVAPKKPPEKH